MNRKMTSEQIEQVRVEYVFGLTGGELDTTPLAYTDDDGEAHTFRFTYDGAPDYAGEDFADRYDAGISYLTVVADCTFRFPAEVITIKGQAYKRVAHYQSSGETECPCADTDDGEDPHAGEACPLCERSADETEHGYIYLGDGWCEVVYRQSDDDDQRALAERHNLEIWQDSAITFTCNGTCNDDVTFPLAAVNATGHGGCPECGEPISGETTIVPERWFWWCCSPGCLPEGPANGPFDTESDALAEATDGLE